jgi:hypothetical protein
VLDAFGKKKNRRKEESFEVLSAALLLNTPSFCGATLCGSGVSKHLNDFIFCGQEIRTDRVALLLQRQ